MGDSNLHRVSNHLTLSLRVHSGPHHGHYVSLVKTRGSWHIYDDDVVDAVRESDIPRYFGDSNAGSAYVLYYQAVDIDLAGLGLRETVPPLDKVQQPTDSPESSPLLPAPAFPPGLAEEGDSPISTLSPNATSPTGAASTIGGLFHSLRRGPSTKPRAATAESRKSYAEPSPQIGNLPPLPSNEDQVKVNPTSPLSVSTIPNGKDKQPERKASTWFKRKGARVRPESASEHTPMSSLSPPAEGQDKTTSPALLSLSHVSQQAPGDTTKEESGQDLLDSPSPSGGFSLPILPPVSFGLVGISPHSGGDRRNGYDSPSAGSVSSSFASTSAMPAHQPHFDPSTNPYAPPMAPALSRGSQTPSPTGTRFSKQPNKSLPHLAHKGKKSIDTHEGETSPRPQRPLSASGSEGYKNSTRIPPVPRLPRHTLSTSGAAEASEATLLDSRDRDPYLDSGRLRAVAPERHLPMPPADPQPAESVLSSPPAPSTASSTSTSAANGLIRVSRKLSLSAPMLGFGRKDKEKQKDKEKDRDKVLAASHLSSYSPFSMTPKI